MKVIKVSPRGFCEGVINALRVAINAANDKSLPRPIHILGNIVHNHYISDALTQLGLITIENKSKTRLELLENIEKGTVIFTAHGISDEVVNKAREKGLYLINATCKYVNKTYDYIKDKVNNGYDVIYIGKRGHPEAEGAISINPQKVHLVESISDVKSLIIENLKVTITNQTTMSYWDVENLVQEIKKIYPYSQYTNEICNATQLRQEAVLKKAILADVTIVVGDPLSNNTSKLAEVSENLANRKAYRIESVEDINPEWFKNCETVAVTSGASTPTAITNEVISFLENFDYNDKRTHISKSNLTLKDILPNIK
ncbi:MAG TPA: 4-hydroxy-3-methylbut-2-enyl diphosphate reductase [Haloplasmataceae bacterium]